MPETKDERRKLRYGISRIAYALVNDKLSRLPSSDLRFSDMSRPMRVDALNCCRGAWQSLE